MNSAETTTTPTGAASVTFVDAYPHAFAGAQVVAWLLARAEVAAGRPVQFLTTAGGPATEQFLAIGADVVVVTPPRALRGYGRSTVGVRLLRAALTMPIHWWRVRNTLRRSEGIVHVNDHRGMLLVAVPARLAGRPVVWHVHSVHTSRALNSGIAALAHRIVVPAKAIVERMPGIPPDKVDVLPNPVDQTVLETEPSAEREMPRIESALRIHPDKGVDLLLLAAADLAATDPGLSWTVHGGEQTGWSSYAEEIESMRVELGLTEIVHLVGRTDAPYSGWAAGDVYVQPARDRTEILPLAVIEAMGRAMAVVATDVGAMRELIEPGVTGILVEPERPDLLAEAVRALARDPSLRRRLGAAAREVVVRRHHPDAAAGALRDIHSRVLRDIGRRPT